MQDSKTTILAFLSQWYKFSHPIIPLFKKIFKKLVQGNEAALKYENINVLMSGVAGVTPSGNTIVAYVTLEYESSRDSSMVKHELVTGSTVVSGTEEDPQWYVVLWGEIVRTLSKKEREIDEAVEGTSEEDSFTINE